MCSFWKKKRTQSKQGEDWFLFNRLASVGQLCWQGQDWDAEGSSWTTTQCPIACLAPWNWVQTAVLAAAERDVSPSFSSLNQGLFLTKDSERAGHVFSLWLEKHTHTLYTCSFSFQVHHSLPFLLCSRDGEAAPPNVLDHPSPTSQPSSVPRIPRPAPRPPPPSPRPRPWQGIPAPFKARNHDSCWAPRTCSLSLWGHFLWMQSSLSDSHV